MTAAKAQQLHGRVPALDGVRGIAILLVLLCHLFFSERTGVPAVDVFYRAASAGWVGVDLFFVLSGFLITGILIEARGERLENESMRGYFSSFYARRILRIFPLYYGLLLLALVLAVTLGRADAGDPEGFRRKQVWLWTFTANFPMAAANQFLLYKAWHLTFIQFWSLAVEEQFYMVWPLLVWLCPPRQLLKLSIGIAAASAIARVTYVQLTGREITAYVFSPFRLDGLLLGAACAVIVRSPQLLKHAQQLVRSVLIVWAVAIVTVFHYTSWDQNNRFVSGAGFTLLDLGFAAIILTCVIGRGLLCDIAQHRILRLLGKYSFGLYVLHLAVFAPILNPTGGPYGRLVHHNIWTQLAFKPFAGLAALAVAAASWHLYEKQFLRLKRFFEYPTLRRIEVSSVEMSAMPAVQS